MNQKSSFAGKNVLVTGASRGIGRAIAEMFLAAGANVTICARKPEGIKQALAELTEFENQLHAVTANVSSDSDLERLAEEAENRFGPTHVLVNNAATNPYFGPIAESFTDAWDKTFAVNVRSPYLLSKLIGAGMTDRRSGSIINIASVAGLEATPNMGIYSVSKAALIMLTKNLAREWGEHRVRVNCVCPGLIRTEMSEVLWAHPQQFSSILDRTAVRRIGLPDEIASAVSYFASDESSFTTGAVLQVDGGFTS